jgi:hypothetical protein
MKTIAQIAGTGIGGAARRPAFIWFAAAFILISASAASAQTGSRYCEITLNQCPEWYDGKTLDVSLDVISISAGVRACGIADTTKSAGGNAPAVMFVIDHSGSMTNEDSPGNRYRVTRALIDTIYNTYPDAQIGVAVFSNTLVIDSNSDPNLVAPGPDIVLYPNTGNNARQSYMPLLTLDQPADSGMYGGNRSSPLGIDVLRGMFNVQSNRNATLNGTILSTGGTDITLGFEAALEAFRRTSIAKENQYIIFISDGAHQLIRSGGGGFVTNPNSCRTNDGARCPKLEDYIAGTNTPTTYTVFLNAQGNTENMPQSIIDMTNNIQTNLYSTSNPNSDWWLLQSDYDELMGLMMDNIITPMLSKADGSPKSITISSGSVVTDESGNLSGDVFTFSRRLPLDTTEITEITMTIKYDVKKDSTWFAGGVQRDSTWTVRDQPFTYTFNISRTAGAGNNWAEEQGLMSECENKPRLSLQSGQTVLNAGDTIKANMDRLTVTFDNTGGLLDYGNSVTVRVVNANGAAGGLDTVDVVLTRTGSGSGVYTGTFQRAVSDSPAPGNDTLEHASQDDIMLIFRNPQVPLDVIEVSFPYVSHKMAFYGSAGARVADSLARAVSVTAGETLELYAKLINSDNVFDEWGGSLNPDSITWTLSDQNGASLAIDPSDKSHAAFFSTTAGVYSVTARYKNGAMAVVREVMITVNPGAPKYLEVVFDPEKVVSKADTSELNKDKEFEFDKDVSKATFYVVARDEYGNLVPGGADGSQWSASNTGAVSTNQSGDGSSAVITREGNNTSNEELYVIVIKDGLEAKVLITFVGESSVAIGPNPFVPGKSDVEERLQAMDRQCGNCGIYETYGAIVEQSRARGGNGTGVLVAATAPRSIKTSPGGGKTPVATIIIYDAVGNVVFRSKQNEITLAPDGNTFGFVWDGNNMSGRKVGPGTYLVKIVGTQSDGSKFGEARKIGVTTER